MTDIHNTLKERGARYGDFTDHAALADKLLVIMEGHEYTTNWIRMSPVQCQALRAIADKIARILNGDPNYDNNWRGIAGYATLVLERLPPQ